MDDRGQGKELNRLQRDLSERGLSRREFVVRLRRLGLGFGAAFMLGLKEARALAPEALDPGLGVKSSNPVVDRIIGEGRDSQNNAGIGQTRLAYTRYYPRYARYTRYARVYPRYARAIYSRFLPSRPGGDPGPR
jgi:hypothetical protein